MPIFMIERRYAELIGDPDVDGFAAINKVNDEEEVRWLMSFISADKRKSYCLYEAESAEAIQRAAVRAGVPADVITELSARYLPDASVAPVV